MPKMKKTRVQRPRRKNRRRRKLRIRKPLALKQHNFVERKTLDLTMVVDTEASATGIFHTFTLDELNNHTNYKDLFEYYRINKSVVTFRYKSVANASSAGSSHGFPVNELNPLLYFKVDHNDITADSLTTMRQSMKTRTKQLENNESEFSIVLKPAVQAEAYKSSVATTYVPKWGQWLSTNDGSVPHYGLKAYAIGYRSATFNPGNIQVEIKTYFSCKNNE